MTGCNDKRRFSVKYPDGRVDRFGSCDPKDDDVRDIIGTYFLVHKDKRGKEYPDIGMEKLPDGTLWTNGYYDKEHDGWKTLSEWK